MAMNGQIMLTLGDGACVLVRRIQAEDAAALQRLVGRSSDRSVELRFFGPLKELSEEMAERFADVDGENRYALVALDPEDPEEIVGVVRYERERGTDSAEYAALIEDRFQHLGLGIGLTGTLSDPARENGIGPLYPLVWGETAGRRGLRRSRAPPERLRW